MKFIKSFYYFIIKFFIPSLLHHVLRPLTWTLIPSIYYNIKYIILMIASEKNRTKWTINFNTYTYKLKTLDDIILWFRTTYNYKYDAGNKISNDLMNIAREKKNGFLMFLANLLNFFTDHDSQLLEFFTAFGDCDDMGLYSKRAVKKIGFKNAKRIFILNWRKLFFHYDCIWKKDDIYYLFNYGNIIKSKDTNEIIKILSENYGLDPKYTYWVRTIW